VRCIWWIIHKDLTCECRARRVWPPMLLFGVVVAAVFSLPLDQAAEAQPALAGARLWLATFFAGMLAMDRSFASERDEGCWEALLLYPVSPAAVYLAKLAVNALALAALQAVLVPVFGAVAGLPAAKHPTAMLAVAVLGNLGISAVGTLLSGLCAGLRQTAGLLALLVLPAAAPVVLAAAEATRLLADDSLGGAFWQWIELLGACAVVFTTAGTLLIDFAVEE
jgi:heme exporter protein B